MAPRDLIFVPIEPLEERYSAQWLDWFLNDFYGRDDIRELTVVGSLTPRIIKTGQFLDVFDTCRYKADQMAEIIDMMLLGFNGTIFFMDMWFPGIEHIAYIRDNAKVDVKIAGILHAGTWDPHDFLTQNGLQRWARFTEAGWMQIADLILVATQFHKSLLAERAMGRMDRVKVVQFPCFTDMAARDSATKEDIVVFPHRLAPEKQPEQFEQIERMFKERYPEKAHVKFIRTKDACETKAEYYQLLAKSKVAVSTALQETFGIAMLEAVAMGCIPVAPNRLSYTETLRQFPLYQGLEQAVDMIADALQDHECPEVCHNEEVGHIVDEVLKL